MVYVLPTGWMDGLGKNRVRAAKMPSEPGSGGAINQASGVTSGGGGMVGGVGLRGPLGWSTSISEARRARSTAPTATGTRLVRRLTPFATGPIFFQFTGIAGGHN